MDKENEWIYEYLFQFLKSPGWKVPILNFIDDYCEQFEDTEENKLIHTDTHNMFKNLVDELLESICINMGITYEQFFAACASGVNNRAHHKTFEQILACDNFQSFKRLMIKRNKQLDQEAIRTLPKFTRKPIKVKDEDNEIEKAIKESIEHEKKLEKIKWIEERELRRALRISQEEYRREQDLLKRQKRAEEDEERRVEKEKDLRMNLLSMAEKAREASKPELGGGKSKEVGEIEGDLKVSGNNDSIDIKNDERTDDTGKEEVYENFKVREGKPSDEEIKVVEDHSDKGKVLLLGERSSDSKVNLPENQELIKVNESSFSVKMSKGNEEKLSGLNETGSSSKLSFNEQQKSLSLIEKSVAMTDEIRSLKPDDKFTPSPLISNPLASKPSASGLEKDQKSFDSPILLSTQEIKSLTTNPTEESKAAPKSTGNHPSIPSKLPSSNPLHPPSHPPQDPFGDEFSLTDSKSIQISSLIKPKVSNISKSPKKIIVDKPSSLSKPSPLNPLLLPTSLSKPSEDSPKLSASVNLKPLTEEIPYKLDSTIKEQLHLNPLKPKEKIILDSALLSQKSSEPLAPLQAPANLPPLVEEEIFIEASGESLAERQARLKNQRDLIIAQKKLERRKAVEKYLAEGGAELIPAPAERISQQELAKRRNIISKLKGYNE